MWISMLMGRGVSISGPTRLVRSDASEPNRIGRAVLSSVVGTAVEWYDFLIYGLATALVFNKLFFPLSNSTASTLAAFATLGVGYFARPLGAVIFGHFGDRIGRKSMLALTIILMGLATFLVGLLPTYEQIGVAAPVLLVAFRLIQGIGLGGEWGGAVLMAVENAAPQKRGFMAALVQLGYPIGNLAAIGVFAALALLPTPDFLAWAWRVPFLLCIVLAGVGLWIRLSVDETLAFGAMKSSEGVARLPIVEVLTEHWRPFVLAVGLKLSEISYATIAGIFVISYVTGRLGLPRSLVLNAILVSASAALVAIPAFGWLSDRIGRKPMFYAGCMFEIAFAFPLFWLLDTKDPVLVTTGIAVALVFGQYIGFSVGASWYPELFGTRTRYSGASLGFQVGAAISGGLTPFAAASFVAWTGGATWPISIYLIVLATISLAAAIAAPETAGKLLS
jgi:MFS transporter, MHS family, shikimate and dehydroshikimate transport protein